MLSLPEGYQALVIGASGAIGAAFVAQLQADRRCAHVHTLHRHSSPALDLEQPDSIAQAAAHMTRQLAAPAVGKAAANASTNASTNAATNATTNAPPHVAEQGQPAPCLHLIVLATGFLHTPDQMPEKRLADLDATALERSFRVNTIGPALVLRHFAPLLARQRSVMALLSAKVGSIGDNRLGGWYGYRASKAALNMVVKTAAIELRRSHPGAVLVALHPGTVSSALSRPFRGEEIGRPAAVAAAQMLTTLDALQAEDSGSFVAYDGKSLPW